MRLGPVARAVGGLVAAGAAVAAYALVARPWYLRWGATDAEVTGSLPGDDLAKDSAVGSTRAVTIAAPVEDVWPWLVQIGYGRGGFYSYDALENLFVRLLRGTPGYRSADTIVSEHQGLRAGDVIPAAPPDLLGGRLVDRTGWKVLSCEPNRALVLEGWGAFVLEPLDDRATRLIVRSRGAGSWGRLAHYLFWEPAHFVMERRMLLGIKARAERLAAAQRRADVAVTARGTVVRRLARVALRPRCRLVHRGRKTGRRHEIVIWFLVDGDVVYLVTRDRHRQWVQNVLAHPSVELRIDEETFHGTAEPLARPAETARVSELLRRKYWLSRPYLWFRRAPDAAFRVHITG